VTVKRVALGPSHDGELEGMVTSMDRELEIRMRLLLVVWLSHNRKRL
jgi:hypothetical protein